MASITKLSITALLQSRSAFLMGIVPRQTRSMCTAIREGDNMKVKIKPTDFERKMLVWAKKYKTVEEVPESVNLDSIQKARNRFQIRISNWLMIISGAVCVYLIYNGKQARDRGESLTKSNLQWHKEYNEQHKKTVTDYSTHFDKLAAAGSTDGEEAAKVVTKK